MKYLIFMLLLIIIMFQCSCKKFLDQKPDQTLAVPATLQEAQALLDYYTIMNNAAPNMGSESDDDIQMSDAYFNAATTTLRDVYLWKKDIITDAGWNNLYKIVLYTNTCLETLEKITVTERNKLEWQRIAASAKFQRAVAFYFLAQYYATPYVAATASTTVGIPLRLSADINTATIRNTLGETFQQIVDDITDAAQSLPATASPLSRPSRPAAFGFLARVLHTMEDYERAANAADSALSYYNTLIDYNTVSQTASAPFQQFNAEVVYPYVITGSGRFSINNFVVSPALYNSYLANDLRKLVFFRSLAPAAGHAFKGNYEGGTSGQLFTGIAVNELFLIKAESEAWKGNVGAAMNALNTLLVKRFRTGTFVQVSAATQEQALNIILMERRKELIGRGLRWFDLRRLNKYPLYAKTLVRSHNGNQVQLLPLSANYTFYIPQTTIDLSGIQQNVRE